jgi:YegS/Rv2252/BmrU family lipid kinase
MIVDLIVNPASGPAGRRLPRSERVRFVSALLRARGATTIRATQTAGIGDGARAARAAREEGSDLVVVWGGDGTLNEVAGALLDSGLRIGVVAGGSGNGFARGLGLPLRVEEAVRVAFEGRARDIDTGEVSGRAFLNLAGVGFDAAVAERVNTRNLRRGLGPYVSSIFHEWRGFDTQQFHLVLDDALPIDVEAHFVVVCNGPQYGHGARIAPAAAFDDGLFDVVAVPQITASRLLRHGWRLFNGTVPAIPGVFTGRARRVEVSHERPLPVHLDGEVVPADTSRTFTVRPRSLRVMTP